MATTRKRPSTIAQAKKAKSKFFYGKGNKKLAAVTKEDMEKAGFKSFGRQSLRKYLEQQKNKPKQTAAKVAPRPRPRPAPKARVPAPVLKAKESAPAPKTKPVGRKTTDAGTSDWLKKKDQEIVGPAAKTPKPKPTSKRKTPTGADLNAPQIPKSKSKSRPRRGSSAPLSMRSEGDKGFESPSPFKKYADPYKDVGRGKRGQKGQAPVPTTEEKVAMAGLALSALGGPGTIAGKAAIKGATKFGKPFITNLIKKIKDLAPKQQKEVLKAVNKGKTKTEAAKLGQDSMRVFTGRQPLAKDRVEPYITKVSKPLTKGESEASRTMDAARQTQRTEIDPGYTGGALKRGGQIKKYNKGGKVIKRKEGGQVMSGSDLVSSLYD